MEDNYETIEELEERLARERQREENDIEQAIDNERGL